jgi:putative transposase
MLVRYRYRIDPTLVQRQALARAFGCARVVYNDALAERRRAYQAGERISDAEVQRRVITQAKRTPERAWLTEVASVALVQACWFATIAASDGSIEAIVNPRHLRAAEVRLARAQRQLSRKRKGSKNRAKARLRVAVAHRRVRDQRADHHHKLALRLIRENQTIAVEDLAVAGLVRTRLAMSVHGAGWGTFLRLLETKAAQHGRQVVKVGRWEPTSQTCSVCGHRDGPKPLSVRAWACPGCGTIHDRDGNAARNILVAAGLAETLNACGGPVRPGATLALASEAGTHRGAV